MHRTYEISQSVSKVKGIKSYFKLLTDLLQVNLGYFVSFSHFVSGLNEDIFAYKV